MKVIGYIRVSSDKQDLQKQEHLLLKYAQQHNLQIDEFVKVEISSRKDKKERRIDELLKRLDAGDTLLVAELSRLGRNMFGVINIINFSFPYSGVIKTPNGALFFANQAFSNRMAS